MELVKVKIEDVYPDEANPRQSFEGIEELADSFDLNAERPGEPFTPPLLVRDGGIYRIVDGERRYRALKLRKAKEFMANVCADMDEADAMAAMLATDDKAPLTEIERSRGAQRMLLLGVDPVRVEKAARFKGAEKLAAVMAKADDAAEDLTLDRALAAAEFLDDDVAFSEIMSCKESDWRWKADSIRRKKQAAAKKAVFIEVCEAHGVAYVEHVDYSKYMRHGTYATPDLLDAELDEIDPALGTPLVLIDINPGADIYFDKKGGMDSSWAEEAEARKSAVALDAAAKATFDGVRSFFWSKVKAKGGSCPNLEAMAFDGFKSNILYDKYTDSEEVYGFPELVAENPSLMDLALGYNSAFDFESRMNPTWARAILSKNDDVWYAGNFVEMADMLNAAVLDGFELDEAGRLMKDALDAFIDCAGGEEDE